MPDESPFDVERKRLWNELVHLQNAADEYDFLFAQSQERIDLLNRTARWFFGLTQRILMREIILAISRITDRPEVGGRQNLTLAVLLTDPKLAEHGTLRAEIDRRIAALREMAEPIRRHRNKYIAHLDHAVAVNRAESPLPKLPRALVEATLKEMQAIYNLHGGKVYDSFAFFEVQPMGGSKALTAILEIGERWRDEDRRTARERLLKERGYPSEG